jgi:hypothetical protein
MINIPAEIRTYLSAQTSLTALTGSRIFAERNTPPKTYRIENGSCTTFKTRGGSQDYTSCLLRPSVQFKCYGSSESRAYDVYRALFDVLNNAHPAGSQIVFAREEVHGQTLIELETEWYFTLTFYRFNIRNI